MSYAIFRKGTKYDIQVSPGTWDDRAQAEAYLPTLEREWPDLAPMEVRLRVEEIRVESKP